ncbi:PH domain-containing protein [Phycicoccus sp. CSK15P-2]|uniref:PH domain-containing protein n=1 Tax=Phycicoccus sp. CSK15P-2 TaxID=2807627 RepID=UPI00194ED978|nr:PH domain-containing protein [Phycicoccus sp. CSK15P-2]MBM6403644.1 PH domain-containing protein [Phycicoccus sp. CSK15P-2]MBM6405109.1 PH domain-containing protein [Phycicoccus sp. CSK15P-2]
MSTAEPPPEPPEDRTGDEGWQRLHPLSPMLRGGLFLVAVVGYLVSGVVDRTLRSVDDSLGVPGAPDTTEGLEFLARMPLVGASVLVVVLALIGVGSWVSWRFARFRVADGQVELRSGVLFRQHRQVPLERIQAVETTRPLLARLTGLSQVVVQSAGGSDSHLALAYLHQARAEEVRAHLLELAGQADETVAGAVVGPGDGPVGVTTHRAATEEEPVVTVPNGRLFVATILHGSSLALALIAALALGSAGALELGVVVLGAAPALVPVVFGLGVVRVKELLVHGNFALSRTGTALRIRHGLTELRAASVPLHRVQAVEAVQPLWWRPFGWWRLRVNVAGVHGSDGDDGETTLLPVGTLEETLAVLAILGARSDDPLVATALHGSGPDGGWVGPPRAARWFDPLSWRRIGYALSDATVHLRSGRLGRRVAIVPYARVQSTTLGQGPIEARLGLASAKLVSTPGPVSAGVRHLTVPDAERFLDVVGERTRVARRRTGTATSGDTPLAVAPLAPDAPRLVD